MSATTLSAMIERLVAKGEVRRIPNAGDARSYLLELTPQGKATNARNARRLGAELTAVRANLEGDPHEILAAMRMLEAALRGRIAET
jgi:DNA-binding MarR family transcriptional regulator